jgi:putative ABC transport system permease protein
MPIAPGQLSYDPKEVPVLWMSEHELAGAFQMDGAFNSVALTLGRDVDRHTFVQQQLFGVTNQGLKLFQ